MELGLSLGVSSSLKPFVDVAQNSTSEVPDLSCFFMGLSLPLKSTDDQVEIKDIDKHLSQEIIRGSSEGGSSGKVRATRGFDVNRAVAAVEEEVSSATPWLFGSDLSIYRENVGNKRSLDDYGNQVLEGETRSSKSKASDEDENGLITRKKLRLSKQQSAFLEQSFMEHTSTLKPKQKHALAKQLNLRLRQVEVWFQNRRARTKLRKTEVDCEYLKRYFETLTKENRKLHKELQELRALKTSSPFYLQSPATTLTMCPSCHQGVATSTPSSTTTVAIAAKPTTAGSF